MILYLKAQAEHQRLKLLYNQFTIANDAPQVPFSSFNIAKELLNEHPKGTFKEVKEREVLICYVENSGDIAANVIHNEMNSQGIKNKILNLSKSSMIFIKRMTIVNVEIVEFEELEQLVAESVGVVMILSEKSLRVAACTFALESCVSYSKSTRAILVYGNLQRVSKYSYFQKMQRRVFSRHIVNKMPLYPISLVKKLLPIYKTMHLL